MFSCSANHLPVRFFSASTTFSLWMSLFDAIYANGLVTATKVRHYFWNHGIYIKKTINRIEHAPRYHQQAERFSLIYVCCDIDKTGAEPPQKTCSLSSCIQRKTISPRNFASRKFRGLEVKANHENQFVLTVRAMALSEASRKVRKNLIRYRDGAEQ